MKKILKQILLIAVFMICTSFAAFAQQDKDDRQKTPPKEGKPPVGVLKPKKDERPKEDKRGDDRNNDNRNKKPQSNLSEALRIVGIVFD